MFSPTRRVTAALAAATITLGAASFAAPSTSAQSVTVNCDAGDSLSDAVRTAADGAILTLTGTCEESVHIPRTTTSLTIDGGGDATIAGPDRSAAPTGAESFTFFIEGQGVTLTGLTVTGGAHGIHLSGPASATIVDNTITDSAGGVHLDKDSTGQIAGNHIHGNLGYGINVQENSYARIGFTAPTRGLNGNVIEDNEGPGISVKQWSSAWISGNAISGNSGHGVSVDRQSLGEVYDNTINANGGDGVHIVNGSGLSMTPEGNEAPSQVSGNHTDDSAPNLGYGISCALGGFVTGDAGSVAGARGTTHIDATCAHDSADTPPSPPALSSLAALSSR